MARRQAGRRLSRPVALAQAVDAATGIPAAGQDAKLRSAAKLRRPAFGSPVRCPLCQEPAVKRRRPKPEPVPLAELRRRFPDATEDLLRELQRDPSLERFALTSLEGVALVEPIDEDEPGATPHQAGS